MILQAQAMYSTLNYYAEPGDYIHQSGSFDITDSASVQCTPVTIISDSVNEPDNDCFTYSIMTVSSVPGLVLSPNMATICISDGESEKSSTITNYCLTSYYTRVFCCSDNINGNWPSTHFLLHHRGTGVIRHMYSGALWRYYWRQCGD